MTMGLVRGMTSLNTRKPKQKPRTKAQQAKFEQEHKAYNKRMKQQGLHSLMMSIEDYDLYVRGMYKPKQRTQEFREIKQPEPYRRPTQHIPSRESIGGIAAKQEPHVYSGERQLLGIATMHKSNMVPIFADNKEHAKEIAQMRR